MLLRLVVPPPPPPPPPPIERGDSPYFDDVDNNKCSNCCCFTRNFFFEEDEDVDDGDKGDSVVTNVGLVGELTGGREVLLATIEVVLVVVAATSCRSLLPCTFFIDEDMVLVLNDESL